MRLGQVDDEKQLVILHGEIKASPFSHEARIKDWIGLMIEENCIVEMRVVLAHELEKIRKEKGITQGELARRMGTKQSGVARMVNNPDTSTLDNLMKGLIALGAPISRIAACLLLCSGAGN